MRPSVHTDSVLPMLWRRKWIIVATVLLFAAVTGIISKTLPKEYETSSELLIVQQGDNQTFDAVQAAQVSARTYGNILTSPNIARLVKAQIDSPLTVDELARRVTAEPVPETQLLRVTITDGDPQRAKRLADVYSTIFVDYVKRRLTPSTRVSVSLADVASVPESPVRPKPTLYVLLATLVGLGIGLALAVLRDRLDQRMRSPDQIEAEFNLPVLARLPRRGRTDIDQQAFTEAFRLMRTNLQFMRSDRPMRSIAVTSYDSGEGKSTTVINLSIAVASSGGRVLAVESDIKRPALQAAFAPEENAPLQPGLTTFIVGTAELEEAIHATRYPSVDLLPAGPQVPSLSGLLQSERGREVVARVAERSQLALFDLPPLNAGADAATLAARTDGTILVVDLERATRSGIREALRQLDGVRANVIGLVVNRDRSLSTVAYGYGTEVETNGRSGRSRSAARARR